MILNAYQSHMDFPLLRALARAFRPNHLEFQWMHSAYAEGDSEMGCHMCPIPLFVSNSNDSCELSVPVTAEWFTRYVIDFSIQFQMEEWKKEKMESPFEMKMFNVWGSINLRLKRTAIDIKLTINGHQLNDTITENIAHTQAHTHMHAHDVSIAFFALDIQIEHKFHIPMGQAPKCTQQRSPNFQSIWRNGVGVLIIIIVAHAKWFFFCRHRRCCCCSFIESFQLRSVQFLLKSSNLKSLISKAGKKNAQMKFCTCKKLWNSTLFCAVCFFRSLLKCTFFPRCNDFDVRLKIQSPERIYEAAIAVYAMHACIKSMS